MTQCVKPLSQLWPAGNVFGTWLPTLRQDCEGQDQVDGTEAGGKKTRAAQAKEMDAQRTQRRTEHEPKAKRHADQPHFSRALLRRSNVGDIRLGHCDVCSADARQDSR